MVSMRGLGGSRVGRARSRFEWQGLRTAGQEVAQLRLQVLRHLLQRLHQLECDGRQRPVRRARGGAVGVGGGAGVVVVAVVVVVATAPSSSSSPDAARGAAMRSLARSRAPRRGGTVGRKLRGDGHDVGRSSWHRGDRRRPASAASISKLIDAQ